MVNCNPETVSTDYDTSDRLYFESLTFEDVMEIIDKEKAQGRHRAVRRTDAAETRPGLEAAGAPIIGTSPDSIDLAEDRERFQQTGRDARNSSSRRTHGAQRKRRSRWVRTSAIRWSCGRRTSSAAARWRSCTEDEDLAAYMEAAISVPTTARCCSTAFLDLATEVDVDIICDGQNGLIGGIMEHIEQAGVHSGDSGCSLPPFSLDRRSCKRSWSEQVRQAGETGSTSSA